MKTLEKGSDKIKKICDVLRHETLEPAKQEAQAIIEDAKARAAEIIAEAERQKQRIIDNAKVVIEQERNVFQSSLVQASKQSMEALRQIIEHKLFNDQLQALIDNSTSDPTIIAKLINTIVQAIEKEGLDVNLSAVVPRGVSVTEVNRLLLESVIKKLKEGGVTVGTFGGGLQVKLLNKKMTIDMTDAALKELVANYVRKDFRKLLFAS